MHHREWGLEGWVAEVEGRVAAYTFGGVLSPRIFCLFVEITDPARPGLGVWLFQEFCRRMKGSALVNTMGDEGLEGLRRAKESYRPLGFARSWMAVRAAPEEVGPPTRSDLPRQNQSRLSFESLH